MVPGSNAFGDGPLRGSGGNTASMDRLEQTLNDAAERLRDGPWNIEEQVKISFVQPILRALGWDVEGQKECKAEYPVGNGKVDYALLDHGKPLVLVEAKGMGGVDIRGEEQLFGYGTNQGIPFLVLTDGNQWDFYLSMEQGPPEERRFWRLFLKQSDKIPDYVEFLERYFSKDRVLSGEAKSDAEKLHKSNRQREKARDAIPGVFKEILKRPDEMLRDLLVEQVESECGTRPETGDVEEYLKMVTVSDTPQTPERRQVHRHKASVATPATTGSKIVGFILDGDSVRTRSAIDVLAELLKKFHDTVPGFMERFASRTKTKKRNLVAQKSADLYLASPDLEKTASLNMGNGWWLGTNMSEATIRKRIETACEVAGVRMDGARFRLIEE